MSDIADIESEIEDLVSEEESVHECESGLSVLENDYRNITAKLEENEELVEFADAYTRLFEYFSETYQDNQESIRRITQLEEQIEEYNDIIVYHEKNAENYEGTIADLESEVIRIKHLADCAHNREQNIEEIIENMRGQIVKLNNDIELKSRLGGEDEEKMGALNKTQEGFEREKQRMIDEITSLKQKLKNALSYSEELEHKNSAADLKANELNLMLEQYISEGTKKNRQIEKLEGDINALNLEIEGLENSLSENKDLIDANNKQIANLEMQLRLQRNATEKANKHGEMIQLKLDKCQLELDMNTLELNDLKEKHTDLTKACRLKNDECNQLRSDVIKLAKHKENIEKKLISTERLKYSIEQERDQMRTNIQLMEREVHLSKKQADNDKKTIDGMTKEKEILSKNLMRVQGTIEGHMQLIKIQEQSKRKLEAEIQNLQYQLHQERKQTRKLEGERNRAISESLDLTQQVEDAMDDNNIKQKNIYDLKKMIAELETKLRQQQNLFESVRAERNALQKQVQEVVNEVTELKAKLKISIHQGQQLKEDIAVKEAQFLKQENNIKKLHKEREALKTDVQNGLNHIQKLKHEIAELLHNEKTLVNCIAENEANIKKREKQYDQMLNDRDVIGAQLVRRNDEIGLLSEKINIFEITLARGEIQYDQRIDDIKILKIEVQRLRQEKNYLSKSIANMTDLKTEVFTLERELARERLKCRGLEEELQHPMNIHRWRKLEGSDPHILDLTKKVQILQKRLLDHTSESIQRENDLKEAQKLYFNLRQMLARQPGPEMKNELIKTKKALTFRGTKLKCMVSELSVYETQIMEYKMDIDKISKELLHMKQLYYKQKKFCQSHLGEHVKLPAIKTADNSQTNPKFNGGGFKMAP